MDRRAAVTLAAPHPADGRQAAAVSRKDELA
jgi:hypothetical protein